MTILFPPLAPPPPQPTREVVMLRRQTREFIKADMRLITFWFVGEHVPNGAGGFLPGEITEVFEQEMRLIPFNSLGVSRERTEGTIITPSWVLLGEYNALMEPGYRFFMPDGQVAEVLLVEEKRLYQTKGEVILHGEPS